MLKTMLITATLAISSGFIGYNADTVIDVAGKFFSSVMDIRRSMQGVSEDPEAAFWQCWNANPDAATCKPQADAWAARDGREYVMRKAAGRVIADSLTKSLAPRS